MQVCDLFSKAAVAPSALLLGFVSAAVPQTNMPRISCLSQFSEENCRSLAFRLHSGVMCAGDGGIESCWPHLGEGDLCAEEVWPLATANCECSYSPEESEEGVGLLVRRLRPCITAVAGSTLWLCFDCLHLAQLVLELRSSRRQSPELLRSGVFAQSKVPSCPDVGLRVWLEDCRVLGSRQGGSSARGAGGAEVCKREAFSPNPPSLNSTRNFPKPHADFKSGAQTEDISGSNCQTPLPRCSFRFKVTGHYRE